jgi:hypothetical protein
MDGFAGETEIDCSVIAFTVRVPAGLTTLPRVAEICVEPAATPAAKPVFAPIVAEEGLEDAHVTIVVMFFVVPSLYVPVAVNCWD